jgi:hypothetical protein
MADVCRAGVDGGGRALSVMVEERSECVGCGWRRVRDGRPV